MHQSEYTETVNRSRCITSGKLIFMINLLQHSWAVFAIKTQVKLKFILQKACKRRQEDLRKTLNTNAWTIFINT